MKFYMLKNTDTGLYYSRAGSGGLGWGFNPIGKASVWTTLNGVNGAKSAVTFDNNGRASHDQARIKVEVVVFEGTLV